MVITCALALIMTTGIAANSNTDLPKLRAESLRCEYLVNPIGIDDAAPRLCWKVISEKPRARSLSSAGYRILVASSLSQLDKGVGDLWDSGSVSSNETTFVPYGGKPIGNGKTAFWKVQVLNSSEGSWSPVAQWTTAPKWDANWIKYPGLVNQEYDPLPNNGFHGGIASGPYSVQWVQIDLGTSQSFEQIRLYPARPYDFKDTPGFLFPVRFTIDVSDDPSFATSTRYANYSNSDFPNPGASSISLTKSDMGRYVRMTVTKLAQRDEKAWSYALAEMEVVAGGKNIARGCSVTASDMTESGSWGAARLVDGETVSRGPRNADPLPATYLRKEFALPKGVKKATLYVSALGLYEMHLNGKRVGNHILAPEWTDYRDRVQFQGYDVTELVKNGKNCIGAILGDGWYSGRIAWFGRAVFGRDNSLFCQLEIESTNGETTTIRTDGSWLSSDKGPIRKNDILDGETYDAKHEIPGWDLPDFKNEDWKPVAIVADRLPKELDLQPNEPIRTVQELKPISVNKLNKSDYVVDLGQNMVGWARVRCSGKANTTVTIRYFEVVNEDGTPYRDNLRGAPQIDTYTYAKDGVATIEPHFTYHGFRYVEVMGASAPVSKNDVTGIVFCSSSPETAQFECSNPMVNRLWKNIFWTQRANLMSTPTDCPQRDERLGWMGDIQAFAQTACYNMDMSGFFAKWMQDVRDAQSEDGLYPEYVPYPPAKNSAGGAPAWSDAGVFVPWAAYRNYGDKQLIAQHYESARKYVDFLHRNNPNGLWLNRRGNDFNDWLNGDTLDQKGWPTTGGTVPQEVLATAFMARSTEIVSEMATVLGKTDDASKYRSLCLKTKDAFCKVYVDAEGQIKGDTQAGYALALSFNMLPENRRAAAVQHLKDGIKRYGDHISTGIQTTHHLMLQLTRYGASDLAYKLLLNRTFPSWGYTIDNGATTIWERWDGYVKGRGFQNPGMNSMNHWALGAVGEWIAKNVGGIAPGDEPGWKHPVIHPIPGGDLKWAKLRYDSIQGPISCSWSIEKGPFTMEVSIPVGVTATVYVPATSVDQVKESGVLATQALGVKFVRMEGDSAVFEVGSGSYSLSVKP